MRRVYHFDDGSNSVLLDSSGNDNASSVGTSSDSTSVTGWGRSTQLQNSRYNDSFDPVEGEAEMYFSGWIESSLEDSSFGVAGAYLDNNDMSFLTFVAASDGFLKYRVSKDGAPIEVGSTTTVFQSGSPTHFQCVYDGSNISLYINGVIQGQAARTGNIGVSSQPFVIGSVRDDTPNSSESKFQHFKFSAFAPSEDYLLTEYANQNDPASFYGTPTIATTGGGADVLTPSLIATSENFFTPSVSNLLQVLTPNGINTQEAFFSPAIGAGGVVVSMDAVPTQELVNSPTLAKLLSLLLPTKIATQENIGQHLILGGDKIAIPTPDRATWNRVANYLRTRKFKGSDNDVLLAWLRSEGYEDQFNDAFDLYLEDVEALQGSLTDKTGNWRKQ